MAKGKGKQPQPKKANPTPAPAPAPAPNPSSKTAPQAPVVADANAPVAANAPSIDELFSSLDRHIKANDYKQIIRVADQILVAAPGDADAFQCKVVALVQDDNIDGALAVIEASPMSLRSSLSFYKAYCLYRKNHLPEALSVLKNLERTADVLQLEAQILYRQADFDACIESYRILSQKHGIHSNELKTNLIASYISGGKYNEVPSLLESLKATPSSAFELAYNSACAYIEKGDFKKAEELLLLSSRIGQEMLIEEEYTKDEIENELAPISVQLTYVQQMQGRTSEALENYNQQLKNRLADEPSMAVASNNLTALKGNKELSDSLKRLDKLFGKGSLPEQGVLFVESLEHKLSSRQKEAIAFNRFLVLLLANKLDQAREFLQSLYKNFEGSVMPSILNAALLAREGKLSRAEELLGQQLEKYPNDSAMLLLARAQVAAQAGHHMVAANSLEQVSELQHKPAMVATLVALKEKGGDVRGAEATLDAAVQWWENHMSEDTDTLELIMRQAAEFKLKHKNLEAASLLFQRLTKSNSEALRAEALKGLVSTTVHTDLAKAEEYERQLVPLPGMAAVNVSALEQVVSTTPLTIGGKRPWTGEDDSEERTKDKSKKRRKKRPRYPKGFDPANPGPPPDPERWLPKRERSTYRPRRKDRRHIQIRGAQGAVAKSSTVATNSSSANAQGPSKPNATNAGKGVQSSAANVENSKPSSSNSTKSNKSKKKSRR